MRLPVEISARLFRGVTTLLLAGALAACGALGGGSHNAAIASAAALPANGPQADYPVLVGEPYQIGGTSYRPNDTLNYDEVGYLAEDPGAVGITGSHHTLPVPSYAEVTSLTTGRTILVRLERRGPMASNHLLALSPAALAQIDATAETPVRVRRVNPPEEQRTMLRAGNSAPLRMDTPMALVTVLRRRLAAPAEVAAPVQVAAVARAPVVQPEPRVAEATAAQTDANEALPPLAGATPPPVAADAVTDNPPANVAAARSAFVVQAATFSTQDRANRAATALGGAVTPAGNLFRVRTGPFPTRAAAEASLANVRAAGYSDARILTGG